MAYHVNTQTGEAGKCSATKGKCPFGSAEEHFTSAEAARASYEAKSSGSFGVSNHAISEESKAVPKKLAALMETINSSTNLKEQHAAIEEARIYGLMLRPGFAAQGRKFPSDLIKRVSESSDASSLSGMLEDVNYHELASLRTKQPETRSLKSPTKLAVPTPKQAAQALKDSVREFLDRSISDEEREEIKTFWKSHGVSNKFAAMLKAAELDSAMAVDEAENSVLEHSVSLGKLSVEGTERGSISDALDFDRVLAKGSDGNFFAGTRESGPDTSYVEDVDKTDVGNGWKLITTGMSGQQGYKGPWLHASEQIEGGVAQRVADGEPGLYVAVIGSGPDDDENRLYDDESGEPVEVFDEDGEPVDIGWAIAYKPFELPKRAKKN